MKVVEICAKAPGACKICGGASDRKWFLDMEFLEEFFGHIYYCNYCFDQMAKECGYREMSNKQLVELKEENAELSSILGDYRDLFAKFNELGLDLPSLLDYLAEQKGHPVPSGYSLKDSAKSSGPTNESRSVDVPNPPSDNQLSLNF